VLHRNLLRGFGLTLYWAERPNGRLEQVGHTSFDERDCPAARVLRSVMELSAVPRRSITNFPDKTAREGPISTAV
jgi:hypothetical protein